MGSQSNSSAAQVRLSAPSRVTRKYLDGPFGQIHLAEIGQGPAILFIHQTPRSWDEFAEVMLQLSDGYRSIAMDLPGMGASDAPAHCASIEDYGQAAAAVARSVSKDGVIVCGHHTGGVVALELAAEHPSLVHSLILSSTPWMDAEARLARAGQTPVDATGRDPDGQFLLHLWNMRRPFYPGSHEYLSRFMRDALAARDPAEGHLAVGRYEMEKRVSKVRCPVLLVEHKKDPFATKHTAHMVKAFPQAKLACIDNGHVALEFEARAFADVIHSWVADQVGEPAR